ncbi:3-hexulose-6-phosphate synthase [Geomicrobium sp. JSM 1781026]|uniref:3-hexulose-6-phosphate synthase n=1 Tax=Geomicrobium sp. JSM 1781026 TaxID=3344580 RepID=UPI0035C19F48
MKLQLALDRLDWDECFRIVYEVDEYIDIVEIGTGVIKEYGMSIVRELRKAFPHHILLADMKICDAGRHEATQAFASGADIATVMAFAPPATIQETIVTAREHGAEMIVDLLGVSERNKVEEINELQPDYLGLHVGKDEQKTGKKADSPFAFVEGMTLKKAIAGGITLETLPDVSRHQPDIVIVGSALTKATNPKQVAKEMKAILKENKNG